MDLLPGPDEDAAVARVRPFLDAHLGLDRAAERLRTGDPLPAALLADAAAAGVLSAPTIAAEAQVVVELGRVLAPLELLAAVLAAPVWDRFRAGAVRVALAAPRGIGEAAMFGPHDPDVVLVWGDAGIGVADSVEVREVVDSLDPTTPMALVALGAVRPASDDVERRAALLTAAFHAGLSRGAQDMAVEHARTRVQFDRPIGANQAIKHLLADTATRSEAAWASLLYASVSLAEGRADTPFQIAVAARIAADAARRNARTNIQVHGGRGYTLECPAHLFLVRAQILDVVSSGSSRARRALLAHDPLV